jgi:hypothetical protein
MFQESTAISAPILPKEGEIILEHAQSCSFLIKEQSFGPVAEEMVTGEHSGFSTYLAKRARAQSGACEKVHFLDDGTEFWSPGNRNFQREHWDFSTYLAKRARAQSGACAEVHFPDYGTELWSPGSRNFSRKALQFQHLSCKENESSIWRISRGEVFLLMEQCSGPLTVEFVPGKHCDFCTYLAKRA